MSKKDSKPKSFLAADEQDESQLSKFALSDLASFRVILSYAKDFKWGLIGGLFMLIASALLALFSARILGILVQDGLIPMNKDIAYKYAFYVLGLELGSLTLMWQGRRFLSHYSSKTIFAIRESLFHHLQKLPISFYDRQPQGRVVTRVTHDVEGIEEFFTNSMGRLLNAIFMAIFAASAMLITDLRLGAILMLSVVPAIIFIFLTRNKVRLANRKLSKSRSTLNAKLSEYLSGMDVIRSYALENWSKREYFGHIDEYRNSHLGANNLYSWTRPLVAFLCSLPIVLLVFFGAKEVFAGAMGVGLFVTFIRYCERFANPIRTLAREVHVIQQAFTSAERVASFLSHALEEESLGRNGDIRSDLAGDISFNDVWMAYNADDWVLKGLNFSINSGEKIGFVGTTGCGKTTTVSLLSRLYEFQKGSITIAGNDIREIDRSHLRSNIGFVSQDAILFKGTIRQNLTTDESLSDEYILKACDTTGFIKALEMNSQDLDSQVYEGGVNLSVGQRQLLALTRVLIKNPSILILDEATANIDPWFEKLIHDAVDIVMKGRTCIIIAHRLATLEHCDRIFVFDSGALVESGSKNKLMESGGHFSKLHGAQFVQTDLN